MAMTVDGTYVDYSVIQSAHNRRRIDEQQGLNPDEEAAKRQSSVTEEEVVPRIPRDDQSRNTFSREDFERTYSEARTELQAGSGSGRAAMYAGVQNMGRRDELQSMLGFSVYA